jgi:hypothetical protein
MRGTDVPRPRLAAAGLVGLEGLAAAVAAAGFVIAAQAGDPSDRGDAVVLGCLLLIFGAGVLAIARGVLRASEWARTPAYLVQFFGLVVAWYQRESLPALAAVLGVVCLGAVAALVAAGRRTSV